jgi:hypothetical protein
VKSEQHLVKKLMQMILHLLLMPSNNVHQHDHSSHFFQQLPDVFVQDDDAFMLLLCLDVGVANNFAL